MKSLIVEDDFIARVLLQQVLAPLGEAHIAVNGREALGAFRAALATEEPYDLICLDIRMPEMNGHEALRGIREIEKAMGIAIAKPTRIVIVTGIEAGETVTQALSEGADGYLNKPVDEAELTNLLVALCLQSPNVKAPASG